MTDELAAQLHRLRVERNWCVGQMLESGSAWYRARKARQIAAMNMTIRAMVRRERPVVAAATERAA